MQGRGESREFGRSQKPMVPLGFEQPNDLLFEVVVWLLLVRRNPKWQSQRKAELRGLWCQRVQFDCDDSLHQPPPERVSLALNIGKTPPSSPLSATNCRFSGNSAGHHGTLYRRGGSMITGDHYFFGKRSAPSEGCSRDKHWLSVLNKAVLEQFP